MKAKIFETYPLLKQHLTLHKNAPQDHSGPTGVFSEVATCLQNLESLESIVAVQCDKDRETRGRYRLPPTAQHVILTESAVDGLTILSAPPPSLHHFLNACNKNSPQANCALTYSGKNIFLHTVFCQALLQGRILEIPYPKSPAGLYPLLNPPSSVGP